MAMFRVHQVRRTFIRSGFALVQERATKILQLTAKPRRDPFVKLVVQAEFLADHQPDFDRTCNSAAGASW